MVLAPNVLPDAHFAGMVVVSLGACLLAPIVLRALLARFPQRDCLDPPETLSGGADR